MPTEVGVIKGLYLYPVKSMRGVSLSEVHVGLNGIYGDRRYAFVQRDLAPTDGFPWMTGRERPSMILFAPRFEGSPTHDYQPRVFVRTPEDEEFEVENPSLCEQLSRGFGHPLFLFKDDRGNFDSQHLSLFSLATLRRLETEIESSIDHRQFRANIYLEPTNAMPFVEEDWVGQIMRIGEQVAAGVTKKDSRCMMINLHPQTARQDAQVLRTVTPQPQQVRGHLRQCHRSWRGPRRATR